MKYKRPIGFLILSLVFFCCIDEQTAKAQTVVPFQGLGQVQFFNNVGVPLSSGVLYTYAAGTTTPQATFTDSTGLFANPNPTPFTTGARVSIWLTNGINYKFVLCAQNDGSACAPGDVLFTSDNVPPVPSPSTASSTFTGTFISGTANPSTSGALRLAASDSICWRTITGATNFCWSKDANDLLSWSGGSLKFPELAAAPGGAVGFDVLWSDVGAHRWKMNNNNGGAVQIVGSGVDINASDQVTQLHFGSTAFPLSTTAPSSGQVLQWNGAQIVGLGSVITGTGTFTPGHTVTVNSAGPPVVLQDGGLTPVTVQQFTNKNLAGSVALTASTLTTVDSISPTMPAAGGPWRVQVCYSYAISAGTGVYGESEATDGVNFFAKTSLITNANGGVYSTCGWSPTTYGNSANPTFTVKAENTGSQTITTTSALIGFASGMQVTVVSSN